MRKKSRYTYAQSQRATTIEVVVAVGFGFILLYFGEGYLAIAALVYAGVSILLHTNRNYND